MGTEWPIVYISLWRMWAEGCLAAFLGLAQFEIWLLILFTVALILFWHFSILRLHSDAILVYAAEKNKGTEILSCLMLKLLPIGSPEGSGEIQIFLQNLCS